MQLLSAIYHLFSAANRILDFNIQFNVVLAQGKPRHECLAFWKGFLQAIFGGYVMTRYSRKYRPFKLIANYNQINNSFITFFLLKDALCTMKTTSKGIDRVTNLATLTSNWFLRRFETKTNLAIVMRLRNLAILCTKPWIWSNCLWTAIWLREFSLFKTWYILVTELS